MESILGILFFVIYVPSGIWAINKLFYNRFAMIIVGDYSDFILTKVFLALFFGWILIPIAIIVLLFENRK